MKNVIQKQVSEYNLIATAHHEAGHTICGLHNYWQVCNVEIFAPHYNEAYTYYADYDTSAGTNEIAKQFILFDLQATYAGLIAEKMYYKDISGSDVFPTHLRVGSRDDIKYISAQIRKYKLALPGKSTHLLKKQLQNAALNILTEHWDAVKLVAHKLYQKQKLTFDELQYILTRKAEHKEFWKDRFRKIKLIHAVPPPNEGEIKKIIK